VAASANAVAAEARVTWNGLDKFGHYMMHVLLGAVAFWAFRRQSKLLLLVCLLAFSGVTEVWQNFAVDRDPLFSDALINMAGVLTGALATLTARSLARLAHRRPA